MKHLKTFELKTFDLSKDISDDEREEYTKEIKSLYRNAMEYIVSIFPISYEEGFTQIEVDFSKNKYGYVHLNTKEHDIIITIDYKKYNDDVRRKIMKFFYDQDFKYNIFIDYDEVRFTISLSIKKAEEFENANKYNL
jgi:hypothetical protein